MYLLVNTKEKIMNVRDYYDSKNKMFDVHFIEEILKIIQKDDLFKDSYRYKLLDERKYYSAYVYDRVTHFNLGYLSKYAKN